MAITHLTRSGLSGQSPGQLFCAGKPDVTEAVGVTMDVFDRIGLSSDSTKEDLEYEITTDFGRLAGLGLDGRLFVDPASLGSYNTLYKAAGVKEGNVYKNLWVSGTEAESYTENDLQGVFGAREQAAARLALFNATKTVYDPLLHLLGVPYDETHQDKNNHPETQLEAAARIKSAFENRTPGTNIEAIDHRQFLMMALMDQVRGEKNQLTELILTRGYMRISKLGRRAVAGVSCVGCVYSYGGRLKLYESDGYADLHLGLGFSVGIEES